MEPYRVLFPLGILASVAGTIIWIPYGFGVTTIYPGITHPDLMIAGFLSAFVAGFLMTAIPRFTLSPPASAFEISKSAFLAIAAVAFSFFQVRFLVRLASLLLFVHLAIFAFQRFKVRRKDLPPYFLFVGLGLGIGIFSSALLAASDIVSIAPELIQLGRLLFYQGIVLSLIAGVGTQLIPALTGWSSLPVEAGVRLRKTQRQFAQQVVPSALAVLFLLTFLLEAYGFVFYGRFLRALSMTVIALLRWKVWRAPKRKTVHSFLVWLAGIFVVIGLWLPLEFPDFAIHALHIVFVSGFGLLTLMVATRVVLSHGGYGTEMEDRSKLLAVIGGLLILASLTRAIAIVVPRAYLHHLAYAAITWNIAIAIWSCILLPKMWRRKKS